MKECANEIAPALKLIFEKSLSSGIVPTDWRRANVSPLFKKGSKFKPENYRPVSLTSVPCKIMERIIKDEIIGHLEKNELIRNTQHGFIASKSCVTNLLEFLEEVTKRIDEGEPVDIICLDFAKAFDKVCHR